MALPPLDLDTRTYADLVDEARSLIPRYAPQWTDYNASDPGITLLELFAWLVEQDIYRVNRVPERHRAAFVALTGTVPQAPLPATAVVAVTPRPGGDGMTLPAGLALAAGGVPYRTTAPLTVTTAALSAVQVFDGDAFTDVTAQWRDGVAFAALGPAPRPGCVLYLGFDAPLPVGRETSLALAFGGGRSGAGERARIAAEGAPARPAMVLRWRLWDGGGWRRLHVTDGEVSDDTFGLTLDGAVRVTAPIAGVPLVLGAVTAARHWLACELHAGAGDCAVELAGVAVNAVAAVQRVPARRHFAIAAGTPPPLAAPVPGTVQPLAMTLDSSGTITALDTGGDGDPDALVLAYAPALATTPGTLVAGLVEATRGSGGPDQRVLLDDVAVAGGELTAWTLEPAGSRAWSAVATLDGAQCDEDAFTLDPQIGALAFGDGRRGHVLPEGAPLLVAYDVTRAASGAVAAGTAFALDRADDELNRALLGGDPAATAALIDTALARPGGAAGADAEAIEHAAGRAAAALWSHERLLELAQAAGADTLDQLPRAGVLALAAPSRAAALLDFERLALDVPGVPVVRARAFGGLDARYPALRAPGTVSVVLVAGLPSDQPQPADGLLDTVAAYLARRKTLGTRLVVVGPGYVPVTATATLHPLRGADPAAVSAAALAALRAFIDPVTGGPAGRGWPFGRDVHRTEVLALLDGVPGVDAVTALTLAGPDGETCTRVCVGPTGLAVSGAHAIEVAS